MKKTNKLAAVALAAVLAVASAGCSSDTSYIASTPAGNIPTGVYTAQMMGSYGAAQSRTDNPYEQVLFTKVDGISANDWILAETRKKLDMFIATEDLFDSFGLEFTPEDEEYIAGWTEYIWADGEQIYTGNGVSIDDLKMLASNSIKQEKVFLHLYSPEGPEAVSEEIIRKTFEESYLRTVYVSAQKVPETDETYDAAAEAEKLEKFKMYVEKYEAGEMTAEQIAEDYLPAPVLPEGEEVAAPAAEGYYDSVLELPALTLNRPEIAQAVTAMGEGEAKIVETDDVYFLFIKKPLFVDYDEETYKNRSSDILYELKWDDYEVYLAEHAAKAEGVTINQAAIKKHIPAALKMTNG